MFVKPVKVADKHDSFPLSSLHKPIQHASCMMYSPIILGRNVGWWMLKVRDIGPHWLVNQSTPMVSTVIGPSNQPQWEPCGPQIIAHLHVEYVSNIVAHQLWILWVFNHDAWMFCTSRSSSGPKPQPRLPLARMTSIPSQVRDRRRVNHSEALSCSRFFCCDRLVSENGLYKQRDSAWWDPPFFVVWTMRSIVG